MRDHTGPTEPLTADGGAVRADDRDEIRVDGDGTRIDRDETPHLGAAGTATGRSSGPDPVRAVKDPDNRAKLLLGIAALTLLNLLLLVAVLANVTGDRVQENVVVDGVPCVVADHEGQSTLFCQR